MEHGLDSEAKQWNIGFPVCLPMVHLILGLAASIDGRFDSTTAVSLDHVWAMVAPIMVAFDVFVVKQQRILVVMAEHNGDMLAYR